MLINNMCEVWIKFQKIKKVSLNNSKNIVLKFPEK